ncbi:MAG: TlpA family protein disulfide reductase [Rhodoferax sp.]|nr:TlpA family protein disulfide reductase [Rhodoferax sp.]MCF8209512.1 TlpA family protein disulfide reductase [Rhodoferax sp.]
MNKRALMALLIGAMTAGTGLAKTPGEVPIGGVLRQAPMQGLSGTNQNLSDFRGKPLVINVWASWCGPCVQEMGSLERLHQAYGGKQFNVIGISTDDYWTNAKGFLQKTRISFRNFIDNRLFLEHMLGADRLPLTLLVDAKGRVLAKVYGAQAWDSPQSVAMIAQTFKVKL